MVAEDGAVETVAESSILEKVVKEGCTMVAVYDKNNNKLFIMCST